MPDRRAPGSAEGAAHSNRVVRDMARNGAQQCTEQIFTNRFVERRMAHAGADRKHLAVTCDLVEAGDVVDVDKMAGFASRKAMIGTSFGRPRAPAILRRHFGRIFSASRGSSAHGGRRAQASCVDFPHGRD